MVITVPSVDTAAYHLSDIPQQRTHGYTFCNGHHLLKDPFLKLFHYTVREIKTQTATRLTKNEQERERPTQKPKKFSHGSPCNFEWTKPKSSGSSPCWTVEDQILRTGNRRHRLDRKHIATRTVDNLNQQDEEMLTKSNLEQELLLKQVPRVFQVDPDTDPIYNCIDGRNWT